MLEGWTLLSGADDGCLQMPSLFLLGVGCTTAKLTCKLIVAHMSQVGS